MKKITYIFLLTTLLILNISGCKNTANQSKTDTTAKRSTEAISKNTSAKSTSSTYGSYVEEDYEEQYDETKATKINLTASKATIEGTGASEKEGVLSITSGGTYILTGTYKGQLSINVAEEKVHLILNGVAITSEHSSAIFVEQAKKVITTLAKDTTNQLTDGINYQYDATDETEPDATFFSKDDLTINGSGTLEVAGNYNNGIRSKDNLVITNGIIHVTTKNNALKGKDSVSIAGGTYTLKTTDGDAIQANNSTDSEKGWVAIDGGTFTIDSGNDGIQAKTSLLISKATITIKTANGYADQSMDTSKSYKGLKAGGTIIIDEGTYTINTVDDAIHSNSSITINNGKFDLSSGDDGIHADTDLTINNGSVTVSQSYEGLEGSTVTINSGDISVLATDDGINAAGRSSEDQYKEGQFGVDSFKEENANGDMSKFIEINGGTIFVDAKGDGLDSNGDIRMTEGTVIINGPSDDGNGALDYDGTFTMDGGTFVASGSSGMAMSTSDVSSQAAIAIYFTTVQKAGTLINIKNADGKSILSYKAIKDFTQVTISSPALKVGETVTLSTGGADSGPEKNGLYKQGTYTNGIQTGQVTLNSLQTAIDETGATVESSQMGGPGGQRPS